MLATALSRFAGRPRSPPQRIRSSIIIRSAALVTATFVLAASLSLWNALRDRRNLLQSAQASALLTANLLDREVLATGNLLIGLASSPALRSRDLQAMQEQLLATPVPEGAWLIVWDMERQLINTLRPLGAPLPKISDFPDYRAALDRINRNRISISDRGWAPLKGTYTVVVSVRTNDATGHMNGFLSVAIPEPRLSALINEQRLLTGWSSSLLDRNLKHIATSGSDRRVFDDALAPELLSKLRDGEYGPSAVRDRMGEWSLAAAHRSDTSGFTALTQVPMRIVNEPVYTALRQIGLGALVLLLLGVGAGSALARRVEKPIEALARAAANSSGALEFAQARHQSFWEHTPESLFTVEVTRDGRFVFDGINPAHERLTGLTASRIVGKEPHECLPQDVAEAVTARYRECVLAGTATTYDETLDLPGGLRFWRTSLAPVRDPATGRISLLFGSARDVTRDLKASAERASLNERLRSILASVNDCYCTFDREYRLTSINPAALQWLGMPEEAALGASFAEVYSGPHECAKLTRRVMEERLPLHAELPSGMRPGRWLDYHVYPSDEGVSVFFRDITDAVMAREALASMSRQLLASQEEERQRIASELHDSTAQHLVAASLGLMSLDTATGEDARRRREEIAVSLGEALKELRIFTYLVHPPGLQTDGLRSTLQQFVAGFAHRANLKATVRASARIDDLSHDLQRSVFRVVQEALSNAHRHGSATQVSVNAKLVRGVLLVRISDNGRGMSTSRTGSAAPNGHGMGVGIPGMRARMQQFGGDLKIRSHAGGTTVLAVVLVTPREGQSNPTADSQKLFPELRETA